MVISASMNPNAHRSHFLVYIQSFQVVSLAQGLDTTSDFLQTSLVWTLQKGSDSLAEIRSAIPRSMILPSGGKSLPFWTEFDFYKQYCLIQIKGNQHCQHCHQSVRFPTQGVRFMKTFIEVWPKLSDRIFKFSQICNIQEIEHSIMYYIISIPVS